MCRRGGGTIIAHLMFDLPPLMIGTTARSGPSQWLAEMIATFALVLTILGGLRYAAHAIPWGSCDYGRVLVHVLDLFCQSGRYSCARIHHHLCRDCHQSRPGFHRGATGRG